MKKTAKTTVPLLAALLLGSCASSLRPASGEGRPERSLPTAASPEAAESAAAEAEPPRLDEAALAARQIEPARRPATVFAPRAEPFAPIAVPASVGAWAAASSVPPARRAALSAAFREAYAEAVLRGVAMTGALGGDFLHFWAPPPRSRADGSASSGAYAQNWRAVSARPNSWGLPNLVLACAPLAGSVPGGEPAGGRAFVVRGAILDAYGKGAGSGGANGIAGYGAPLTDEFAYEGGIAQRFEFGLLIEGPDGAVSFRSEPAPSATGVPAGVGAAAAGSAFGARERNAFRAAWAAAVDSGFSFAESDGPAALEAGAWGSAWIQRFGADSWALALPARPGSRAYPIAPAVMDALRKEPGAPLDFGEFGLPLTAPYPAAGAIAQWFEKGRVEFPR